MKDLKTSLDNFNNVVKEIDSLLKSKTNNISKSKLDNMILKENQELKNKNANIKNKLEKIIPKINNILEGKQ